MISRVPNRVAFYPGDDGSFLLRDLGVLDSANQAQSGATADTAISTGRDEVVEPNHHQPDIRMV